MLELTTEKRSIVGRNNEGVSLQPDGLKTQNQGKDARLRFVYLALFGLSGLASLVYEIVWVRQFTLVLGASTYAVTIVLAVFMAGMGIGAWALGKWADRCGENRLVTTYALLEAGIGGYALVLPILLHGAERFYAVFYQACQPGVGLANAVRFVLAFLLLVVPTSLMGATLPVLSRYIIRRRTRISVTVSWLYGLNTVGALFGAALAGYVLLPAFGASVSGLIAITVNFIVAISFWAVHRFTAASPNIESLTQSSGPVGVSTAVSRRWTPLSRALIVAFAASGFASMLYEVAWTRTLTMILGTTTYSFTTMLVTFLLGIALGSLFFGRLQRLAAPTNLFVWVQCTAAFSVLLTIPLFEKLPLMYLSLHGMIPESWLALQALRFALAALVMIVPTFALGATFPIVSAIFVDDTTLLGRQLGKAYGMNTLGAVLGATLAGLVLIPMIGMQATIVLGAVINALAAVVVCLADSSRSPAHRFVPAIATVAGFVLIVAFLPPWSPLVMNSGVYVYADRYHQMLSRVEAATEGEIDVAGRNARDLWEMAMKQYDLLYYATGRTATVAVMQRSDGVRFLTIDGKTDASTGGSLDMKTQILLGQLPLLFHPCPDKVFVVGFGSGMTVGSVLTHDVRVVDCAELSTEVVRASRYFDEVNHSPLDDERMRIIERDARNVLLTGTDQYDVIISQPSNPWIAGQSSLFSLEWYQLVAKRLKNDGLFAQWLPAYYMSPQDLKVVMHTMRMVFPHATVWSSGAMGDVILIAKAGSELKIDCETLQERVLQPTVSADIQRTGHDPLLLPFETFVMNEEELGVFLYSDLKRPLRLNTDDHLVTEFSTPKQLARHQMVRKFSIPGQLEGNMKSLAAIIAPPKDEATPASSPNRGG